MKRFFSCNWIIFFTVILLSVLYFLGLAHVPFHPDESTQIFMSSDLDILFTHPTDIFWRPDRINDLKQIYRERDAPLSRYLIGIGRLVTGEKPLPVDWNWSESWVENRDSGALPSSSLLNTSRWSVAFLYPFTLLLAFLIGKSLAGKRLGWILMISFACNALILLHTRRAMAESALLFTACLVLWLAIRFPKRPLLLGLVVALAFSAKQTNAGLFILGGFAILYCAQEDCGKIFLRILRLLLYTATFLFITFMMNPFLWKYPLQSLSAAIQSRQELVRTQSSVLSQYLPEQTLSTLVQKFTGMIVQLYITPPAIAEVGNYLGVTSESETAYFDIPINHLFRNYIGGGILLFMSFTGFFLSFLSVFRNTPSNKKGFLVMILGTLIQSLALLFLIPFPWQRYYMPLLPFACLWTSYFIDFSYEKIKMALPSKLSKAI
jgi:hypothetical protein